MLLLAHQLGHTASEVTVDTTAGAGKSKFRSRSYPRYVLVDGQRYRVWSPEEERQLLEALHDRAREAMVTLEGQGKAAAAKKAKQRAVRIEKRIAKTSAADADWLAKLREDDELILMALH